MESNRDEITIDSKEEFLRIILEHYVVLSADRIPKDLIVSLSNNITDYYYKQYNDFYKKYPKSRKRYSTFQVKDFDHPTTSRMVVEFFRRKFEEQYKDYSKLLLGLDDKQLMDLEDYWLNLDKR
jgi:hypothetical protein